LNHTAYDRDLLREQILRLRKAAAARSKLEQEIATEHEKETTTARQHADADISALEETYARESDALRREHAAVIEKADAEALAERSKLDTQRKGFSATIDRNWEQQSEQLKGDAQFEDNSAKEVFKDKRKEPGTTLQRTERSLAAIAAQLGEADSRSLQYLKDHRIKDPGIATPNTAPPNTPPTGAEVPASTQSVAAAAAGEPLPTGADLLPLLEQLHGTVASKTTALLGLKSVATAFSGGTKAAGVALTVHATGAPGSPPPA
jgi:hypothetical protein